MCKFADQNMLVFLNISQPQLSKKDREASVKLANDYGADKKYVSSSKKLYDSESYGMVTSVVNKAREFHKLHTNRWLHNGYNILSGKGFMAYANGMREFHNQFDAAVQVFVDNYESTLERMRLEKLVGLHKDADYPSSIEIANKFGFDVSYAPVPTSNDFRIDCIDELEAEGIRAQLDMQQDKAIKVAMADVLSRINEIVTSIRNAGANKTVLKTATYDKFIALADALPALNVAGDDNLDEIINDIQNNLVVIPS